jgi:hypothetical protein
VGDRYPHTLGSPIPGLIIFGLMMFSSSSRCVFCLKPGCAWHFEGGNLYIKIVPHLLLQSSCRPGDQAASVLLRCYHVFLAYRHLP